jgi:hypothetical protein
LGLRSIRRISISDLNANVKMLAFTDATCVENLAEAGAQWPPLNELCWGIFNVQRAWHSLNTGPRFSFSSKGQVGQICIPRDSNVGSAVNPSNFNFWSQCKCENACIYRCDVRLYNVASFLLNLSLNVNMYNVPSPRGCVGIKICTIPALIVEGDWLLNVQRAVFQPYSGR